MYTIDALLADRDPVVREIYDRLIERLAPIGAIGEEPKKTCVHLVNRTGFGGVHPRKSTINLEFKSVEPVDSPRIARSERVSANRFHNTVKLSSPDQLDDELLAWLRSAYELSA